MMSAMSRELLAHTPLLALPIFAMFLFLTVFVFVVVRTLTRTRGAYTAISTIPMENDDEHT